MLDDTRRLNSFLRKTRRGHVLKITHELYLRTDIPCGSHACIQCPIDASTLLDRSMANKNSLVSQGHYLVVDTNIVLQQVDKQHTNTYDRHTFILDLSSSIYWKMNYSTMLLYHKLYSMR
jgi:tRNA U34 2-thiouridine synthase MnmA/TrmU